MATTSIVKTFKGKPGGSEYIYGYKYCRECERFYSKAEYPEKYCKECGCRYRVVGKATKKLMVLKRI